METQNMPSPVLAKYNSLPPRTQNNARGIFLHDWEWAIGNPTKESVFADKWGLDYDGKYATAEHRPEMTHAEVVALREGFMEDIEVYNNDKDIY